MEPRNFPRNRKRKQEEAQQRQAMYSLLTPAQKLAALDAKLGPEIGASRQRQLLQKQLTPDLVVHGPHTFEAPQEPVNPVKSKKVTHK